MLLVPLVLVVPLASAMLCQAFQFWLLAFETDYKTGSNDLFDGATTAFQNGDVVDQAAANIRVHDRAAVGDHSQAN